MVPLWEEGLGVLALWAGPLRPGSYSATGGSGGPTEVWKGGPALSLSLHRAPPGVLTSGVRRLDRASVWKWPS